MLVAVVVGLAVCIAVTAYLDYVVLDWVIGIGYQPNALYGDCLNAEMLAFGAFGAVLVKFSIPEKRGNTLALIVFLLVCSLFWVTLKIGFTSLLEHAFSITPFQLLTLNGHGCQKQQEFSVFPQ